MMTKRLLRHLYTWHLDLLLLAAQKHQTTALVDDALVNGGRTEPLGDRQNALFVALARTAGNPEHVAALKALGERLQPM